MKLARNLLSIVVLLCSTLLATPAMADWQVDNSNSVFYFVTTKASSPGVAAIQEVQTFKKISGQLKENGSVEVQIDLTSLDTGIALRDQRIKDLLFKVAQYPNATFAGKIDIAAIKKLPPGAWKDLDVEGKLTLSGATKPIVGKLRFVKLADHHLLVETRAPFIINAADFKLEAGVETLKSLMGFNVLSRDVPVNFSIVLK